MAVNKRKLETVVDAVQSKLKDIKIICFNVGSLKSSLAKGLLEKVVDQEMPDIMCLQETKCTSLEAACGKAGADIMKRVNTIFEHQYYHSMADKKGYSGTAIWSKLKAMTVIEGFHHVSPTDDKTDPRPATLNDNEARVLTAVFESFVIVNAYVPNASQKLKRIDWKCDEWLPAFRRHLDYITSTYKDKAIVCTGDMNVCMQEIDLARPKENLNKTPGYTQQEIDAFRGVIGLTDMCEDKNGRWLDVWRWMHPEQKSYSYFSYRFNANAKNIGWRLDYFLVPISQVSTVEDGRISMNGGQADISKCVIRDDLWGISDHCPLSLTLSFKI
ncbi:hypothetical protein MIR68_004918 [Amoeboaphelidium protococcarum]|nr:hypothetical protein MIR68_004918 [Amoeboaphelidium protococcarum]